MLCEKLTFSYWIVQLFKKISLLRISEQLLKQFSDENSVLPISSNNASLIAGLTGGKVWDCTNISLFEVSLLCSELKISYLKKISSEVSKPMIKCHFDSTAILLTFKQCSVRLPEGCRSLFYFWEKFEFQWETKSTILRRVTPFEAQDCTESL